MNKTQIPIIVGIVAVVVLLLVFWGRHVLSPPAQVPLAHGSVTLPATGVPPIWAIHNRNMAAKAAAQPAGNPALQPGAPAQWKQYLAQHPEKAAQTSQ